MSNHQKQSDDSDPDDPIIVFDQNDGNVDGNGQTPIGFGFRQPSFVWLHGEFIPKGFGSLADFKAVKQPVKVEKFVDSNDNDGNSTSQSIHELLRRRNEQKWKEMGYDPEIIEKSLNRNTSHSAFISEKPNIANKTPASASFTNIDSLKMSDDINMKPKLAPLIEENELNQSKNVENKKLTRSLSSGRTLPFVEMPNNSTDLFQTELFKNCKFHSSENDEEEEEEVVYEDNIPPNLRPFIVHSPDSFTYRALCGDNLKELRESAKELVINDLNYYLEVMFDYGLISEFCYIQSIIANLRNENTEQSIQEMSELDYRIYETSSDIESHLNLWKQQEEKIVSEKENNMKVLDKRFREVSFDLKKRCTNSSDYKSEMLKYTNSYHKEKSAIMNLYNSKMSSINNLKKQSLTSLSQRLLLLKRQKEELLNEQQKQNDLLKPKAATSRPVAPHLTFRIRQPPINFPKVGVIQDDPALHQCIRPRTPGQLICKPKIQKRTDTDF